MAKVTIRTIPAGEFKAKCLAIMDEVKATGQTVIVTKRGKPVAWLTPPREEPVQPTTVDSIFNSLRGIATMVGDPDEWIGPIFPEDEWDHLKPDWSNPPPE
jgi:prevent-host-death family protein